MKIRDYISVVRSHVEEKSGKECDRVIYDFNIINRTYFFRAEAIGYNGEGFCSFLEIKKSKVDK